MAVRRVFLAIALALATLCAADARASVDKTKTEEEPLSLATLFESMNDKFQNATKTVEQMLGVEIPSTKAEVQNALQENLDGLKQSAQNLQKKLAEYNVTGGSLSDAMRQMQAKVDSTVRDLAQRNPDIGELLEQVKTGYGNLADVGKKVGEAVQQQAGGAQTDLQALAEQAKAELTGAAAKLETRVQELMATQNKKST